jgi:hypothetical protein
VNLTEKHGGVLGRVEKTNDITVKQRRCKKWIGE